MYDEVMCSFSIIANVKVRCLKGKVSDCTYSPKIVRSAEIKLQKNERESFSKH